MFSTKIKNDKDIILYKVYWMVLNIDEIMGLIEERQQHKKNKLRAHDVPFYSVLNIIQPTTAMDKLVRITG